MKVTSLVASIPFFLLSLLSMRASADSVDFGTNSQINRPYQISIKFDEAPDKVRCGLNVDWGDGVSQEFRVGSGYDLQHPYRLEHTYTTAGMKKVTVRGVFLIRGLGSVPACNVSATVDVNIEDPAEREMVLQLAADEAKKAAELKVIAEQARLYREHLAALALNPKSEATSEANGKEAAGMVAKKEVEIRDRLAQPSPDFLKQQAEAEKKRLVEEQAAAVKEKKEKAEALAQEKLDEKQRQREEKERLAREKIEREEQEKLRLFREKELAEQGLRENARQALARPLIARQDPRIDCQARIELDQQFSQLKAKISLSGLTDLSFPMLANQAFPNAKEQQLIALLADEFKRCINQSVSYRFNTYSKEQNSILEREDAAFLEASIDLYAKKINFGSYNNRIQQIAKDSKSALSTLEQKIQSEKLTREQDARTRAAELRQSQARQEQQRRDTQERETQARQAAAARAERIRQQWESRCQLDKRNAEEQYRRAHENDCRGANSAGWALLCVAGQISGASDYANAAYASCMSAAPQ